MIINPYVFPGGGGGFTPLDIAGLQLWLDASAITGLSDTDPIATWIDSSGNGYDATQATSGLRPLYNTNILNGLPVVNCVSGGRRMATTSISHGIGTGDFFVSSVVKAVAGTYHAIWANGSFSPAFYINGLRPAFYFGADQVFFNSNLSADSWYVISGGREAGVLKAWVDGVLASETYSVGTSISNAASQIADDGSGSALASSIAELVFAATSPTADRASTEDYLGVKYGITITH